MLLSLANKLAPPDPAATDIPVGEPWGDVVKTDSLAIGVEVPIPTLPLNQAPPSFPKLETLEMSRLVIRPLSQTDNIEDYLS